MTKWMLAAGAAALAISAPVLAEKGGQGGKNHGNEKAQVDRGGGQKQAKGNRGGGDRKIKASHGGDQPRAVTMDRGNRSKAKPMRFVQDDKRGRDRVKIDKGGNERARAMRIDDHRGKGRDRDVARMVKFDRKGDHEAIRLHDRDKGRVVKFDGDRVFRARDVDRRGVVRFRDVDRDDLFVRRLGFGGNGCPPGLDKKNNGCLPPGQAAKFIGRPLIAATRVAALDPLPRAFRNLYWDNDDYYYRYGGGYLYRVDRDRDLIDGLIPLFGAALIGQPLNPYYVNSYYQPPYFNSFYPNSPYDCYRYGYGYVYETDCMTGLVEDVIPTYDYGYGIGQIMPAGYSYYNVPYAYRSHFVDDDDYYYRYAPGAIYRVDRSSALISAVAALLTGGLTVGQPLPAGYSAYNVPLAYRSTYYDQQDVWYRYDNGYIYAVDPGTQLVRSIAYTIV